ncbi:LPG20 [Candida pseudojiufengensis]|uniref:LPG20 n=1 Tax=Candida pseudojiufengensis TaxID=497109 RepID=UPI002224EE44|nr:LPG20 [Candida pseudojiufengensis]KAI5966538.1 LPG20 [Candida pseudojiufengensis]
MSVQLTYNNLGDSGLKVSPLIIGCMGYGAPEWAGWVKDDEEEIFKILKKCYDNQLRTFDTADVYSNGKSEILLGKFLKKYNIPRDKVVIMTKCFFAIDENNYGFNSLRSPDVSPADLYNSKGLSRKHILEAVNGSVRRLGTYIDVLQIHRLDPTTPKKEIMRALNDVVEQGLTRYIGASSMKATEFAQLQFIAEQNGWFKFISMQNYYNLLYREEEREMIPFCQNNDLGKVAVIPWSPIARGVLARPLDVKSQNKRDEEDKTWQMLGLDKLTESDKTILLRVEELSKKHAVSMAVVATAWVLSKGCYPIVGISSEERADDIIKATTLKLSDDELKFLEEPYIPKKSLF